MANKQSAIDKSKPVTVGFFPLMSMGLSKATEWEGEFFNF
jgi:hypothetical protein